MCSSSFFFLHPKPNISRFFPAVPCMGGLQYLVPSLTSLAILHTFSLVTVHPKTGDMPQNEPGTPKVVCPEYRKTIISPKPRTVFLIMQPQTALPILQPPPIAVL